MMNQQAEMDNILFHLTSNKPEDRRFGAEMAMVVGFRIPALITHLTIALQRELRFTDQQHKTVNCLITALLRSKTDVGVNTINEITSLHLDFAVLSHLAMSILHEGDWRYAPAILTLLHHRSNAIYNAAEGCLGRHAPRNSPLPDSKLPARYHWRELNVVRARRFVETCGIPIDEKGNFIIHRTVFSPHQRGDRYLVGETYHAPIFSYDQTQDCAPGLYVADDRWLWAEYRANMPWIAVQANLSDLLVPDNSRGKARLRQFTVAHEKDPIKPPDPF